MTWIAITIALLVAIIGWSIRARYTRGVRAESVGRYVEEFAEYSAPAGVLEVQRERSEQLLQFAKRDESQGLGLIEFGFPEMSWSRSYFPEILNRAEAAGFSCIVEEGPVGAPVRRFLRVRYGANGDEIAEQSRDILAICSDVMGFGPSDTFKIRFRGVISPDAMDRIRAARRSQT
jgi:hypothetical protein